MSNIEQLAQSAMKQRMDAEEWAVERMMVLPGDLGCILETWMKQQKDGGLTVNVRATLTNEVPPMTIAHRDLGFRP